MKPRNIDYRDKDKYPNRPEDFWIIPRLCKKCNKILSGGCEHCN